VTVAIKEIGNPIPPETWTLTGLNLPAGTPVSDLRIHKRIGYWDGKGLSKKPSIPSATLDGTKRL
jgi:hypothetical protein